MPEKTKLRKERVTLLHHLKRVQCTRMERYGCRGMRQLVTLLQQLVS